MSRTRRWTAVGIVGVLALVLGGLLWRNWNTAAPAPQTTTTLLAVVTTTDSTSTTATTVQSPTTTTESQRIAEVEAILIDLWFGWLDAIYRKDADALWNVVATDSYHDAGVVAMDDLVFENAPSSNAVGVSGTDILLDRSDCVVASYNIDFRGILAEPPADLVSVMWPDDRYGLRFATGWLYPDDLWLADCDEMVREETP
ncbi:MAG: hypothetical protein ABR609_01435 [Acidimicrobiia bacterium]